MVTEKYVFPSLIEGYIKGLGERFSAKTRAELKKAGLDVERLPPAIPAEEMKTYTAIVARTAFPDSQPVEQLQLLGASMIRGWQTGLLGSAASAMIRLIGPRRALNRLDRAFSTTNNFSKAITEFVGEKEALITITDVQDIPSYWLGIFEAGIELLGLQGTVIVEKHLPPAAVFRIRWE